MKPVFLKMYDRRCMFQWSRSPRVCGQPYLESDVHHKGGLPCGCPAEWEDTVPFEYAPCVVTRRATITVHFRPRLRTDLVCLRSDM